MSPEGIDDVFRFLEELGLRLDESKKWNFVDILPQKNVKQTFLPNQRYRLKRESQ